MLQFVNASQMAATSEDPLLIDKYVSHNLFGIGQLILRPGAEKGTQRVHQDTMVGYNTTIIHTCYSAVVGNNVFFP